MKRWDEVTWLESGPSGPAVDVASGRFQEHPSIRGGCSVTFMVQFLQGGFNYRTHEIAQQPSCSIAHVARRVFNSMASSAMCIHALCSWKRVIL